MTGLPPGMGAAPMPPMSQGAAAPHAGSGVAQAAVSQALVKVIVEAFDQLAAADQGQLPVEQAKALSVLAENPLYQQLMMALAHQHAAGPVGPPMGAPAGLPMGPPPPPGLMH